MTPADMPAGPEMDALVAEKVMGWRWRKSSATGRRCLFSPTRWPEWFTALADGTEGIVGDWDRPTHIPRYSTDIAAAWEVVEKMRANGYAPQIRPWGARWAGWGVADDRDGDIDLCRNFGSAETVPLAIVRWALAACGVTEGT